MEYRVEELAQAAGVRVDTIRFYQARGLIAPPERRGRVAIYSDVHLERLRRVRELNRQGISLDAIRRLDAATPSPAGGSDTGGATPAGASTPLLAELDALEGAPTYDERELAARTGFPDFLLSSLRELGLVEPIETSEGPRYTEADRDALEAAACVLGAGIPLAELLPLAQEHAAHVEGMAERAVELFQIHVRRKDSAAPPQGEAVAQAFRALLPRVTTLVALHFQRVLLRRARLRLRADADGPLAAALDADPDARLRVAWR